MEPHRQIPTAAAAAAGEFPDEIDSCCSTPFVSAPSSPSRSGAGAGISSGGGGYYYSAPASPTHFFISAALPLPSPAAGNSSSSDFDFDFDFSAAAFPSAAESTPESMTSADELFLNGQIRPMHNPLLESPAEDKFSRRRDSNKLRAGSLRRRTRSLSPTAQRRDCGEDAESAAEREIEDSEPAVSDGVEKTTTTTPRSASAGRSSRRWVFLKEFLYRSKSEGRNSSSEGRYGKFWAFSPSGKEKKAPIPLSSNANKANQDSSKKRGVNKGSVGKRNPSAHEMHYTANRAQAEEMRRKTFLPYRQGLLGCLGFSSRGYGAMNGFARALNPVSSR